MKLYINYSDNIQRIGSLETSDKYQIMSINSNFVTSESLRHFSVGTLFESRHIKIMRYNNDSLFSQTKQEEYQTVI
jgi:hypothetical protein